MDHYIFFSSFKKQLILNKKNILILSIFVCAAETKIISKIISVRVRLTNAFRIIIKNLLKILNKLNCFLIKFITTN